MTRPSSSSPSSPNTKPEPQHHQCCWNPISGLSGSSCASVLPPKPHSKQRSAKYVVKSSKILWIHIQQILTPSTAFFSYSLSYSHVVSNEVREHQIHSDLNDRPSTSSFHSFHHSTFDWLCLDPYCSTSPLMTGSSESSSSSPNTKPEPQHHQFCSSPNSDLSGSSCASVLLPMPHRRQRSANYVVK